MDEPPVDLVSAVLEVPHYIVERFTPEVIERILPVMRDVMFRERKLVQEIRVLPRLTDSGWRERAWESLTGAPTNQARLTPLPRRYPHEDRMAFRDAAGLAVYQGLKRAQDSAGEHGGLTVAPNASIRIRGRTWEVDFLVSHQGRCGVIQVDGATHKGKASVDRSKDRLLEDAGVAYVDRIDAADTQEPGDVDRFVSRFLRRLKDG